MSKRSLLALVPSPFEIFANDEGYNLAPAVSLIPIRIYADRETQVVFDAFNARRAERGQDADRKHAGDSSVPREASGAGKMKLDLFEEAEVKPKHDPGGKVRLALARDVISTAIFGGPADCYRYRLQRTWDAKLPLAMWVMMNPSNADLHIDDSTVAKCGCYARAWGYGGILVGNTFAYRATNKRHLRLVADPIGPDNDKHLVAMARRAHIVIFAYCQPGHRTLAPRGIAVAELLIQEAGITPHVLELSKRGIPVHPLYLVESLQPVVWPL